MLTALPKPKQKTSVTSFSGPCLQGLLTYCLKEKNFLIWLIEEKDVKDSSKKLFLSIMKIHPRSTDWLLSDLAVIQFLMSEQFMQYKHPAKKLWMSENNTAFFSFISSTDA